MKLQSLLTEADTHIVLVVLDGLGGYADAGNDSELEAAQTPNLDQLASEGAVGLVTPVAPGISPGSGPGRLALFGYDPTEYELRRGVLSAAGLSFPLQPGDVAARANLCTFDDQGRILDRRAGRIFDADAQALVDKLSDHVALDDVEVFFRHVASHRVLVVLRGEDLDPRVADLDPQRTGVVPREPRALHPDAQRTADLLEQLDKSIRDVLAGEKAQGLLLRGFDTTHELPSFTERYGLRAATVAIYPMYRGVAQLVGMKALPKPVDLDGQIELMRERWDDFDFFFMHYKKTDEAGHDGDRPAKIAAIEAFDTVVPDLVALQPDVLIITGDHASPTQMADHSWHPVPAVMWGPRVGRDYVTVFGERACAQGLLGQRPTVDLMPLALAAAGRLERYGA